MQGLCAWGWRNDDLWERSVCHDTSGERRAVGIGKGAEWDRNNIGFSLQHNNSEWSVSSRDEYTEVMETEGNNRMSCRIGSLLVILGLGLSSTAQAGNALLEIREENWREAMRIGRVNSEILYAISLQESGTSFNGMRKYGPWPWTMNVNEKARYYSSREAARDALAQEVANGNQRIAVGMWQIYLRYNGHLVEDPLDLLDPVTNLFAAAKVLRECGDAYGKTREVLSCYYSGDVDKAGLDYAERVLTLAERWGKPFRIAAQPVEVRYTHLDAGEGIALAKRWVIETEGDVDASTAEEVRSLIAAAGGPLQLVDYSDFLAQQDNSKDSEVRRVIVVD